MKTHRKAFTVVELITAVTIIAILMGILIPSVTKIRAMAKETKQRAQITTIELAIQAFKNDCGDYPESDYYTLGNRDYSGAQMLSEALQGWDLMGFHPDSYWRSDGTNGSGTRIYPNPPMDTSIQVNIDNLKERKGPYLSEGTDYVFKVDDLFAGGNPALGTAIASDTYVLCDMFPFVKVSLPSGKTVKAGAPILYYKAKTQNKSISLLVGNVDDRTYSYRDNYALLAAKEWQDENGGNVITKKQNAYHPLNDAAGQRVKFHDFIKDERTGTDWPYRPDSYILISAGADGEYGTADDITNFN